MTTGELSNFPKRCSCGAEYVNPEQWGQLDYVGLQDDGEEVIELRNCTCRSTIGVVIGPRAA